MGKKITVDSATMMNKCFEVMEAKNIFDLEYDKIDILTHPDSYVHAVVVYNNGLSKLVVHNTTMKIPIFNTIFTNNQLYTPATMLNLKKLNNLDLRKILSAKFPIIKILKSLPSKHSLFETVIVSVNDFYVNEYLQKKIIFQDISRLSLAEINHKRFNKYKRIYPKKINEVISLNHDIKINLIKLT